MARTKLANAKDENPLMMGIMRAKRGEVSSLDFNRGRWHVESTIIPHYLGRPDRGVIHLPDQPECFLTRVV